MKKKKLSRKQPFINPSQWENKLIDLAKSVERTTGYTVVDKKVYPKMKISEVIKVPISIGDTVLGGKFKNKRIVVKSIGKNDKGDITINNKPLLKYRILPKEEGLGPSDEARRYMMLQLYGSNFVTNYKRLLNGIKNEKQGVIKKAWKDFSGIYSQIKKEMESII